jgi:predicted TIM-barrel fold metal-dependent hydrolase
MRIDVNAFLGRYPFRHAPGGSPQALLEAMDRIGVEQAWLSNLSAVFWRDPTEGNPLLYSAVERHPRLRPVPAVHPGLANWKDVLAEARERGAPAVRSDPTFYGTDPAGGAMLELAAGCAESGLPMMLAVRFEDGRQRHPNDRAEELSPHTVRALIRSHAGIRLLITHADRDFIEQVHFGSTPAEAARILWDICWIWGPPEDHLPLLIETMGAERFVFGTGMPLRIPETSVAKLDLLDLSEEERGRIESENVRAFLKVRSET